MKIQDFDIIQGDTGILVVTIYGEDGNEANLTGLTGDAIKFTLFEGEVAKITKDLDGGVTLTDAANGLIRVVIPAAETIGLAGTFTYTVVVTTTGNEVYSVVSGNVIAAPARPAGTLCTIQDVRDNTGTNLDDAILQSLILGGGRELAEMLKPLTLGTDATLREACLHKVIAKIYTRYHLEGTLTTSDVAANVKNHEGLAASLVENYISTQNKTRPVKRWVSIG